MKLPDKQYGLAIRAVGSLSLLAAVAFVDYKTSYELGFFVFYFAPIALSAWSGNLALGMLTALLCTGVWMLVDHATGFPYTSQFYFYWNGVIRLLSFLVFAGLVLRVRRQVARELALGQELREALEREVTELKGLLPICASCKKIRDEQGEWQEVEVYVKAHSGAEFSHGICPACVKALYPDLVRKG